MQLNQLGFSLIIAAVALLTLTTSKVMAQASNVWEKPTQSYCLQDALRQENVSPEENLKMLLSYCGKHEFSDRPPAR